MSDYLGDVTLNFDIRPVTLAYIVRAGSRAGLLRAIRLASNRWGGARELIVPFASGRLAEPWDDGITRVFPPDALIDLAGLRSAAVARIPSSTGLQVLRVSPDGLHQYDGLHQLGSYEPDAISRLELVLPSKVTLQSAVTHGLIGSLAERQQWEKLGVRLSETSDPVELAIAQLNQRTVAGTTLNQCGQVFMQGIAPHSIVIVVTRQTDDFGDANYFWNLRASLPLVEGQSLAIAATPEVLRDTRFAETLEERIRSLERYGRYAGPTLIAQSRGLPEAELGQLVADMGFDLVERPLGETVRRFRLQTPPRTVSLSIPPLRAVPSRQDFGKRAFAPTQMHRPKTVLRSQSPVRFNPEIGGYVFARFSGAHPIDVPGSPSVGPLFMPVAAATRAGIQFLTSPASDYQFEFSVPDANGVLHTVMRDRGVEYHLNDKGRHAHGILTMCGGSWSHSDDISTAILLVLTTPRSAHLAQELKAQYPEIADAVAAGLAGRFGQEVRQRTLTLGEIASSASRKEVDLAPTLRALVDAGLVIRGLLIRCDTCGLNSFTSATSPTERPSCPGCGSTVEFTLGSAGKEPGFWYRLNALVDRASDQGALAVLLAYRAIKAAHPNTDLILGVDLTFNDRDPGDLDLLGRLNREILTGEAKMAPNEFTQEQISTDVDKAGRVGEDVFVVSCPVPLPRERAGQLAETFGAEGIRVWFASAPMTIES